MYRGSAPVLSKVPGHLPLMPIGVGAYAKRRVYDKGIDQTWAVDLIDMQHYAKYNDGYKYLLAAIDVFLKYMGG
jgi:hypothetical protein